MACTICPSPLVVVGLVMGIIWLETLLEGRFLWPATTICTLSETQGKTYRGLIW